MNFPAFLFAVCSVLSSGSTSLAWTSQQSPKANGGWTAFGLKDTVPEICSNKCWFILMEERHVKYYMCVILPLSFQVLSTLHPRPEEEIVQTYRVVLSIAYIKCFFVYAVQIHMYVFCQYGL